MLLILTVIRKNIVTRQIEIKFLEFTYIMARGSVRFAELIDLELLQILITIFLISLYHFVKANGDKKFDANVLYDRN